jgi:hypothetical protein
MVVRGGKKVGKGRIKALKKLDKWWEKLGKMARKIRIVFFTVDRVFAETCPCSSSVSRRPRCRRR